MSGRQAAQAFGATLVLTSNLLTRACVIYVKVTAGRILVTYTTTVGLEQLLEQAAHNEWCWITGEFQLCPLLPALPDAKEH